MEGQKKVVHDFEFIGRILEILRILRDRTDECTTISQSEILKRMQEHEYPCSARTLTDYLKVLMKELNPEYEDDRFSIDDYKIIPKGLEEKLSARDNDKESEEYDTKKLQLRNLRYNHLFSFAELNQVIEAVLFLKSIDENTKSKIVQKLLTLSSKNYPKYSQLISETTRNISKNISGIFEDSKIDEVEVRKNLSAIRKAIEADNGIGRKIAFHFRGYDKDKKLVPRLNNKGERMTYIVSPYYVILYNSKYYLVCNLEPYSNVSIYRIDLMENITEQLNSYSKNEKVNEFERRKPRRDVEGLPEDWNNNAAAEFQTEHLYMFYGNAEDIYLKIDNERYTLLHDFFGERYRFISHIDDRWDKVIVKCVPDAMVSWAMQCSDFVEVITPQKVREKIRTRCEELCKRYS